MSKEKEIPAAEDTSAADNSAAFAALQKENEALKQAVAELSAENDALKNAGTSGKPTVAHGKKVYHMVPGAFIVSLKGHPLFGHKIGAAELQDDEELTLWALQNGLVVEAGKEKA